VRDLGTAGKVQSFCAATSCNGQRKTQKPQNYSQRRENDTCQLCTHLSETDLFTDRSNIDSLTEYIIYMQTTTIK